MHSYKMNEIIILNEQLDLKHTLNLKKKNKNTTYTESSDVNPNKSNRLYNLFIRP